MQLILASTSPYRRALLDRLRLPFQSVSPDVDEAALPGEAPEALAVRLAAAKAADVARRHPGAWSLGSDQVAAFDACTLGKPGDAARAIDQLRMMSGHEVRFLTAACLRRGDDVLQALDITTVRFRALSLTEIERYVAAERPYDCAGSFKAEGLGIALFESIESLDPTALVGLPLIATAGLLRRAGFAVP